MLEQKIAVVISGSFKFKREIDLVRDEFEDLGAEVLDPPKGGIHLKREDGFKPLKQELYLPVRAVEDSFLISIKRADLLYVVFLGGYIWETVNMEIGFASALQKPIFLSHQISFHDPEEAWWKDLVLSLPIKTPAQALIATKNWLASDKKGLYLPREYARSYNLY